MRLSLVQKSAVRALNKALGLKQAAVAEAVRISPSALSEALKEPEGKPLGEERWDRLKEWLREEAGRIANGAPLRPEIESLLGELEDASGVAATELQFAGEPLAPDVANYVERGADHELMALLNTLQPCVSVVGAPGAGKTSALRRFEASAQARGYIVRWADATNLVEAGSRPDGADFLLRLADMLGEMDQPAETDRPSERSAAAHRALDRWAQRECAHSRRVYLIVDTLDALPRATGSVAGLDRVINELKAFARRHRAVTVIAGLQASWCIYAAVSVALSQTRNIRLLPLDQSQIAALARVWLALGPSRHSHPLSVASDDALDEISLGAEIHGLVGGSPYLVQLALSMVESRLPAEETWPLAWEKARTVMLDAASTPRSYLSDPDALGVRTFLDTVFADVKTLLADAGPLDFQRFLAAVAAKQPEPDRPEDRLVQEIARLFTMAEYPHPIHDIYQHYARAPQGTKTKPPRFG